MSPFAVRPRVASAGIASVITLVMVVGPAQAACATHLGVTLTDFPNGSTPASFYMATEDAGNAWFTVSTIGDDCSGDPTNATYTTVDGTAKADIDYQATSGKTRDLHGSFHITDKEPYPIPLIDDLVDDGTAFKSLQVELTSASEGNLYPPYVAPIFIIENEGPRRISVPIPSASISEFGPQYRIPILRSGADVSVNSTVNVDVSGTANEGHDYNIVTKSVTFTSGERMKNISVDIINDKDDEPDETVIVTITGAEVVAPSTSTLTILDNDLPPGTDTTAPKTWFHHPKHNKDYAYGSYKARTIHVFAPTEDVDNPFGPKEPSGIDKVQAALKKKKMSGACQWWTASRTWKAGKCGSPKWFKVKFDFKLASDRYLYAYDLLTDLKPSKGTKVKFYQVWSRAHDGSGNMESFYEVGRNKNKFEINKKKK